MKHLFLLPAIYSIAILCNDKGIAQDTTPAKQNDIMPNGIKLLDFSYPLLLTSGYLDDEFDLTEKQRTRLVQLHKELEDRAKKPPLRPGEQKGMINLDENLGKENLHLVPFGTQSKRKDRVEHYFRARKVLVPHQRKRLDQVFTWYGRSRNKRRFAAWQSPDVLQASGLDRKRVKDLNSVVAKAEKQFINKVKAFQNEQAQELFKVLTPKQKTAYQNLIDPNREFGPTGTIEIPPSNVAMFGSFAVRRELRMTGDQIVKLRKISAEFERDVAKARNRLSRERYKQTNISILYFEIYLKRHSEKMESLFTPKQLGVIEKHYIKRKVAYYGPALTIFDPAIAHKAGISMDKLRGMHKLGAKIVSDIKSKRIELTREGFKFILKNVDKETRAMLKKYFGKPPKFVLND